MCECNDNPPTLFSGYEVKARKPHKCCECLRTIEKGEPHEFAKGLWDGRFSSYRTCNLCIEMRQAIAVKCYIFGLLMDEIDDCESLQCVRDFVDRRHINYTRRRWRIDTKPN